MKEITSTQEIQKISLDILLFVDKICKENNLKYCLAYGTAIGAVRHKGFIPWDDDIDIIMLRDDYDKFLKIIDNYNHDTYKCLHVGDKNYFYGFAKVVDLRTVLEENNFIRNPDLGVYIDVFPVDGVNEQTYEKDFAKFKKYHKLLIFASNKKFKKSPKGMAHTLKKLILYPFVKLIGWKYLLKKTEQIRKRVPLNTTSKVATYGSSHDKPVFDKKIFDNIIEVDFEGYKFPILKDYDLYLTQLYGDYMKLPPEEQQVSNHSFKAYWK